MKPILKGIIMTLKNNDYLLKDISKPLWDRTKIFKIKNDKKKSQTDIGGCIKRIFGQI